MDAMQLVLASGVTYSGDRALPHILRNLSSWRWVARVFSIPGITLVAPAAYRLIARNRMAISTLISRKSRDSDATCSDDSCSVEPK